MNNIIGFPRHKLTSTKKKKENYEENAMDWYTENANFSNAHTNELNILYKVAEGIIDFNSYEYVLNPVNTLNDSLKRFPAKLRNYDIITPVLNLFLGENGKRPNDASVITKTEDAVNQFKDAKNQALAGMLAQDFINNLNDNGIETNVPNQEVGNYKEYNKEFDTSYDDKRAMFGQEALDYIRYDLDFDDKIQEMMYDWLVAGYVVTHKDVYMDDIEYMTCDPRDIAVIGLPQSGYLEDSEAVIYKMYMTRSELMDRFNEELQNGKFEDGTPYINWVETYEGGNDYHTHTEIYSESLDNVNINDNITKHYDNYKFLVYLVNWKGMKKEGTLTYIDIQTGQLAEMVVDDTYKLDKIKGDIKIEWEWVECAYRGFKVDKKLYLDVNMQSVQRNELNNNATCKLGFNGKIRGYRNREIKSICKTGLSYQILYNIVHYRFEFMLAKNKDKILMMPFGLVPRKKGWDEDKWFYWANAHGVGWYDETAPNAQIALQGIKQIDLGLGQYIGQMWELLNAIRGEWWDTVGINRQRYGESYASDGKANTEQAIFRSALITDDMFRQFNKFLEKEYQGLLDYSKVAWINGKKGQYINSDKRVAFFNIEGTEHIETDYGVFVKNTQDEKEKLDMAKNLLQTFGQNGMKADIALEILDSTNMSKVKDFAKKAVELERSYEQQARQQQMESNEKVQQMQSEDKARESEDKRYVADTNYRADVETATIQAETNLSKIYFDTINNNQELVEGLGTNTTNKLNDRYSEIKSSLDTKKLELERQKMANQRHRDATNIKIAKENRNKHDK